MNLLRRLAGYHGPYWLWRIFAVGMEAHMREHQTIRNLSLMCQAPDEVLDRKGLHVKQIAQKLMIEYKNGGVV